MNLQTLIASSLENDKLQLQEKAGGRKCILPLMYYAGGNHGDEVHFPLGRLAIYGNPTLGGIFTNWNGLHE